MFERNQLKDIGGLKALTWGASDPAASKIVVLHGYGASAFDLFDLGQALDPQQVLQWVFPQGPLDLSAQLMMAGYGWFPIDAVAAQKAIEESGGLKYANVRPKGIDESVDRTLKFLKAIQFDPSKDLLGGFSQGSMLCVELQRRLPQPISKMLILSGSLVDEQGLKTQGRHFEGLEIFQSHGRQDEILPVEGAVALRECLESMNAKVRYEEFQGGHEIPINVLKSCKHFLGT